MADYRGHLAGGVAAAAGCVILVGVLPYRQLAEYSSLLHGWQLLVGVFIVAMLFALFPDIDIKSKGQMIFYWSAFLIDILLIWGKQIHAAAYLGLIAILPLLSRHRGWTHSIAAALLVPAPILIIPYLYDSRALAIGVIFYGAAIVGYLSHIVLDGELPGRLKKLI